MTAAGEGSSPAGQTAAGAIEGRLFIVGCSRSGTTLLQSFLAAHPEVLSFPETAIFGRPGQKAYSESRLEPIDF